ncbi:MAG: hypothetical protein H6Q73_1130 [Firmicutes bacterium]|nr:hypothetical protein [Bacillota bacterium]
MFKSVSNIRISDASLEQALNDIIKSIAAEEIALAKILNLEGEIIQKSRKGARNIKEFVVVNESVNSIIENIIKLQRLTQDKLDFLEGLFQGSGCFKECDELEE